MATTPAPAPAKPASSGSTDPQETKLHPHAAPPKWEEPKAQKPVPDWQPKPDLNSQEEKAPPELYRDAIPVAVEQRARSAWIEGQGQEKYFEKVDQRPKDERPVYQKDALAGGGAWVAAAHGKVVPGVSPTSVKDKGSP